MQHVVRPRRYGGPTRTHPVSVPFALVRVPLAFLDRVLVGRLPAGSPGRTLFDLGLGMTDRWAGRLINDRAIARAGRERVDRAGRFVAPYTAARRRGTAPTGKTYAEVRPLARSAMP